MTLTPRIIVHAPDTLEAGVLYISKRFGTALHLCPCGCGIEAVTPLNERGWALSGDDQTASLSPSISNRACPKQSHYFITNNEIVWA